MARLHGQVHGSGAKASKHVFYSQQEALTLDTGAFGSDVQFWRSP
jgi:hypothetical protein